MKIIFAALMIVFCVEFIFCKERSIDDIFPALNNEIKEKAMSAAGYSSYFDAHNADRSQLALQPAQELVAKNAIEIFAHHPLYIIESLFVVPNKNAELVDVFNALGRVQLLQGRTYFSAWRNKEIPLFDEAVCIESRNSMKTKNDPPLVLTMPQSETIYMRLKAARLGNCYLEAKLEAEQDGLFYSLSNFKSINYIFPLIKTDRFLIRLYFEPIREGILIYGITGVDVPEFVNSWVHIPSLIQKRLDVIYGWVRDGIQSEQNISAGN